MYWEERWVLLANPAQLQSEECLPTAWTCLNVWLNCTLECQSQPNVYIFHLLKGIFLWKSIHMKRWIEFCCTNRAIFLVSQTRLLYSVQSTCEFYFVLMIRWIHLVSANGRSPLFTLRKSVSPPSSLAAHTACLLSRLSNFSSASNSHVAHRYAINLL